MHTIGDDRKVDIVTVVYPDPLWKDMQYIGGSNQRLTQSKLVYAWHGLQFC